ncbi:MAG: transglutaminase-like domain-containing protein [Armatimonadota bacterium]
MPAATRPPWSVLALLVTAFAALHLATGGLPILFLLAGAAIVPWFVKARLRPGAAPLAIALAILIVALFATPDEVENGPMLIGPVRARNIFGEAMAIGLTLQLWIDRRTAPEKTVHLALLFGGLTVAAASNTYEDRWFQWVAAAFVVACIFALRAARRRDRLPVSAGIVAVALGGCAFGLGLAGTAVVGRYKTQITEWGNKLTAERSLTDFSGVSDQPALSPYFPSAGENHRVLKVRGFAGGHLRGMGFSGYKDGLWFPPVSAREYGTFLPTEDAMPTRDGRKGVLVEVQRLVPSNPIVYAPLSARQVDVDAEGMVDWDPADAGPIAIRRGGPAEYAFRDLGSDAQGLFASQLTPEQRVGHLMVPPAVAQRIAPIARKIVDGANSDKEKADRVAEWLMAHHPYKLGFRPGGKDPVVAFLEQDGTGAHCEFFASAAALLLRTVGVPTRYVVGYYAHETVEDDLMLVRQRDAHAWVEAYVDGGKWMTVEATPPTGMPDSHGTSVEGWRRIWEQVQDNAKQWLLAITEATPDQFASGILAVGGVFGGVLWFRRRRGTSTTVVGYPVPAPWDEYARTFESTMQRRGVALSPSATWKETVAALPSEDPVRTPAIRFVELYEQGRFGGAPVGDAARATLEEVRSAPRIDSKGNPTVPSAR